MTWPHKSPSVGDIVIFAVTIKNQGPRDALASTVNYVSDGAATQIRCRRCVAYPRWLVRRRDLHMEGTAGSHTLAAFADSINQVTETVEDNNSLTLIVNERILISTPVISIRSVAIH